MKRSLGIVIGIAAAIVLIAAVGASAHGGITLLNGVIGTHHSQSGDEASGARTESPEPTESPEASPSPEPTEKPEPSPTAEATDADEQQGPDESNDNEHHATPSAEPTEKPDGETPKGGSGGGGGD